jgi:hypothetical protein
MGVELNMNITIGIAVVLFFVCFLSGVLSMWIFKLIWFDDRWQYQALTWEVSRDFPEIDSSWDLVSAVPIVHKDGSIHAIRLIFKRRKSGWDEAEWRRREIQGKTN